jgi:hypothetical protein
VHAWSGQCNKNLGNAFVIVWRIGDESQLASSQAGQRNRGRAQTMGSETLQGSIKGTISARCTEFSLLSSVKGTPTWRLGVDLNEFCCSLCPL